MTELALSVALLAIFQAPIDTCAGERAPVTKIATVEAKPDEYDKRTISISGVTQSSGETGLFLVAPDGTSIKLVDPDTIRQGEQYKPCRDQRFRRFRNLRFWDYVENRELKYQARTDGTVRILRDKNGKIANSFDVFGQWPVELVIGRVLEISEVPENSSSPLPVE